MKIARIFGFSSSAALFLTQTVPVFAQSATAGASKGGTGGALPDAGSTELTYLIFLGGVILFVFGMLKLILSFRSD